MANETIKLDQAGVRKLLRSEEMKAVCKQLADNALARCGDGYEVNTHVGKNRVNAEVYAKTKAAKKDNLKNNTILKALR